MRIAPPLRELFGQIEYDSDHGNKATGRSLVEHFGREPYGWDFEVVRLLVAALLAADKVQIRSGATDIDSRRAPGAKDALTNNNTFRSASISPKKGIDFGEVAKAAQHFKETFGTEVREINQSAVAAELRAQMAETEDDVQAARTILVSSQLPGAEVARCCTRPHEDDPAWVPRMWSSASSTTPTRRLRTASAGRRTEPAPHPAVLADLEAARGCG